MKKSILIGLLSAFLISGCGRPDHYREKATIDFSAAYAALTATFNQGVLILVIQEGTEAVIRRFWIQPNISQTGEYNALFSPGRYKFYAVGYSGSSSSFSYQCGYQAPIYINPGPNTISMTLSTCSSGTNDVLSDSEKISVRNQCQTNFNSNFHCGP